jgi:signal transduction histidine kinase
LGAFVAQIVHPDGTPVAFAELARVRALRGERISSVEMHIIRTDGRAIPVLVSAGPIRDAAGEIAGAVVVFEDITVLKDLERLRDEWTSIIAHDLRQPVSVITGYGGVLAGQIGDEDTPSKRALTHILAAARQLDRMINDLLDVSRIDTRRLTLERQATDLPALVRTVVERAAEITKEHQVQVSIAGEVPEIAVDPGRIEQIVDNLLSNAAKYGSPGAPIRVEVARCASEVELAVVNRGRGIAPEDVPCLFTRFHRTGMAKEDKVPGVGLGLYITKGLVEAHGGRIWVESVPGETTAFRFVLPLAA